MLCHGELVILSFPLINILWMVYFFNTILKRQPVVGRELNQREGLEGQQFAKLGRKYQHD